MTAIDVFVLVFRQAMCVTSTLVLVFELLKSFFVRFRVCFLRFTAPGEVYSRYLYCIFLVHTKF
jgi:hypothetical protein